MITDKPETRNYNLARHFVAGHGVIWNKFWSAPACWDKTADQVLNGQAKVLDIHGTDVTPAFTAGAYGALTMAQKHHCKHAILTENSPSCGRNFTYSGRFDGTLIKGMGLAAALLLQNGIQVWPSNHWTALDELLKGHRQ